MINESRKREIPFLAIGERLNLIHGITMSESDIINLGLLGWDKIGNKDVKYYRYNVDVQSYRAQLPCNVYAIEAVSINVSECSESLQQDVIKYIINDVPKYLHDLYPSGSFINFENCGDHLKLEIDAVPIEIIYEGIYADKEGLPYLNEKEAEAISYFLAYMHDYKNIRRNIANSSELMQFSYKEWDRLCADARVPEEFTQNQINQILDVKFSWDRKQYGKSFKIQ